MSEDNGFEWTESPVEIGVAVKVPTVENGQPVKKRVVFDYRMGMGEFTETYKSKLFADMDENATLASVNALYHCFEQFCVGISGPGFDGKSLAEAKKLCAGHVKLREAAGTSAGIVSAMFRVEEDKSAVPLPERAG